MNPFSPDIGCHFDPKYSLKVKLPTGETETLVTSLNQKQLPIRKAAGLYFKRWAVETSYDLLKSKLQLENFSGKTAVSVKQDFYATMYLANLASFIAADADEMIAQADADKDLKYPRK
jgi:IS4 transposase